MFLLVFGILMGKFFKIKFEFSDVNVKQKFLHLFFSKKIIIIDSRRFSYKEIYDENETKMDVFCHSIS